MAVAVNWIKVLNEWFCEKSEKTGAEGRILGKRVLEVIKLVVSQLAKQLEVVFKFNRLGVFFKTFP